MIKLVVFNQYNEGPLWYIDEDGYFHDVKKDDLKKDEIILDLTSKMNKKYITIYDTIYNCEDKYQDGKIEKQKETYGLEMLNLVNKLKKHLNEKNDGVYEVIDYETAIINIQYLSKKENKIPTNKIHLVLSSDFYVEIPIWCHNDFDGNPKIPEFVSEDSTIKDLGRKIDNLYTSYLDDNQDEDAFIASERDNRFTMLEYYRALRTRLEELNDGSYDVIDVESIKLLAKYGEERNS